MNIGCLGLEILKEAAHYVENQQQQGITTANSESVLSRISDASQTASVAKKNGYADESSSPEHCANMHMRNLNENNSTDDCVLMEQNFQNSDERLQKRLHSKDRRLSSNSNHESPTESYSPARKQHVPPTSEREKSQQPNASTLSDRTGSKVGSHKDVPNPMMHFAPQPLMYPGLDPALYMNALERRTLDMKNDALSQNLTGSSPLTTTANALLQGFPHYMYPYANPALFMSARDANPSGVGLSDISMVFPPRLPSYTSTADMLPHPLSTLASLNEQRKLAFENVPNLANLVPPHILNNPYLKSFSPPDYASVTRKDLSRRPVPKAEVNSRIGNQNLPLVNPDSVVLAHQSTIKNEGMKLVDALSSSSPHDLRRSLSPESHQKSYSTAYSLPRPVSANVHSSLPERHASSTVYSVKNGDSEHSPFYSYHFAKRRSRDKDFVEKEGNCLQSIGDLRQKIATEVQRSSIHSPQYKSIRKHRSPSPNNDCRDHHQMPRDLSLGRSVEKSSKMQCNPISDIKNKVPGIQDIISTSRVTSKSPLHGNRSPNGITDQAHKANATNFPATKSQQINEKNNLAYSSSNLPYVIHPALAGLAPSFALPTYFHQGGVHSSTSKTVADALTANSSHPTTISPEILAEYSRLTGISPYAMAWWMPQQQGFGPSIIPQNTSTSKDYSAALKQAAMQQNLLIERVEKERIGSPVGPYLPSVASVLPFLQPLNAIPDKVARGSPKTNATTKHSSLYQRHPTPRSHNSPTRPPAAYYREEAETKPFIREISSVLTNRLPEPGTLTSHYQQKFVTSASGRSIDEERNGRKRGTEEDRDLVMETTIKRKREITSDTNAPDIEEHFRRSLGENYPRTTPSTNEVNICDSVDDHFQKALGNEVWSKLKPNKSVSPQRSEDARDGADAASITGASHLLPHCFPSLLPPHPQFSGEVPRRNTSPPTNSFATKMVTMYPLSKCHVSSNS